MSITARWSKHAFIAALISNNVPLYAAELKTVMRDPSSIGCNSGGGDTCRIDATMDAEPNFVICQVLGTGGGGRSIEYRKRAENPLPGDPQRPPRYKTAHWWGHADSSNNPFGGYSSNVNWDGMGILQISINASLQERWDNNCQMQPER